jgi:NAD+ diphosphatase
MIDEANFYSDPEFDRASRLRDHASAAPADAPARLVPVWRGRNLIIPGDPPIGLFPQSVDLPASVLHSFLGLGGEGQYWLVDLSALEEIDAIALAERLSPDAEFVDLRQVGVKLSRGVGAMLAYARGLAHWHSRTRFCGVCGSATIRQAAGHSMICSNPACKTQHFPRTDPATIVLVEHGGRCLLGRQPQWPPGMYSTLAGFVEIGESLEDGVRREVFEESGIRVGRVTYHSSQPWPFPQSLMLGFTAEALTTDITVDRTELEDARWFSPADIANFPALGLSLPRADSIARRLVDGWLASTRT